MKINPKADHYVSQYKEQGSGGYSLPPAGIYHVVNVTLQRSETSNGTKKLVPKIRVLKCVESSGDGAASVGKSFFRDLWCNFEKQFNLDQIVLMGIACGQVDEWDPDDDKQIVRALTGVPYVMKFDIQKETWEGKTRDKLGFVEVKALSPDEKKHYTNQPDWSKSVGDPSVRMIPARISGGNGGGGHSDGGGGGGGRDPFDTGGIPYDSRRW